MQSNMRKDARMNDDDDGGNIVIYELSSTLLRMEKMRGKDFAQRS
jgi:hypothetical protein